MTIRFRLMIGFIAVILLASVVLSLVTVTYVSRAWLSEVQNRVRLDLNSARAAYEHHIDQLTRFVGAASLNQKLIEAAAKADDDTLRNMIERYYAAGDMDMLIVVAPDGTVRYRSSNPPVSGDNIASDPIVAKALQDRTRVQGTVVLPSERLVREGPDLSQRAHFELIDTPAAKPTEDEHRADGMVAAAAVPLVDESGTFAGLLYAGDLLNRRYEIVDEIRDQVFAEQLHEGRTIGTVTIFQNDLRIATNVERQDGRRAVGTRLSAEVYDEVLEAGGVWADRAFVVNDWYITAYEPIRDPTGKIIGALYVGLLEAPFAQREWVITGVFLATIGAITLLILVLLFVVTKLVLRPVEHITSMSKRIIDGDLSARVDIDPPGEMGTMCRAVNAMADAVAEREAQLKEATKRQISQSEKLASIGRLAAGVAHEINNPLTGVLTFAHLLREKENLSEEDKQDLDVIISETQRVGEIVRNLLDFARERPSVKQPLDLNQVIVRTTRLLRNQKQFRQVHLHEELQPDLPLINGDTNQLQQVLLNLALNGCEAMPEGGTLTVQTRVSDDRYVRLDVSDTGEGIPPERLDQIFEPFFTTKSASKGTGLGLSVTYGIIEQHQGHIDVHSTIGRGSTFSVYLPIHTGDSESSQSVS